MRINPEFHEFDVSEFKGFLADRELRLRPMDVDSLSYTGVGDSRKVVVNDSLTASGDGFKNTCKFLGIPAPFMRKVPLDLAETISTRMLGEAKKVSELIISDNKVAGVKSKQTPYQSAVPVVDQILKDVPKIDNIKVYDLGMSFDAAITTKQFDITPKVDDIVRGGLRFLYSEFFYQKPVIEPYTERLVCLNGMTHRESWSQFEFVSFDKLLADINGAIAKSLEHLTAKIEPNLKKATEIKIDGAQAIRRIFKRQNLSTRLLDKVLAAHLIENDGTSFGVLQAFTRAANELKYHDRTKLQDIGGRELVTIAAAHCPSCYADL